MLYYTALSSEFQALLLFSGSPNYTENSRKIIKNSKKHPEFSIQFAVIDN